MPMFVMTGSVMTHATSPGARAFSRASTSLKSMTLDIFVASGTMGPSMPGTLMSSPKKFTTSVSSTEPWYVPLKHRMSWRPVTERATLSAMRLASVAVMSTCQKGRPNLLSSSFPTQMASSVGSMVVVPRFFIWSAMASTIFGCACPHSPPVSPRQRSR